MSIPNFSPLFCGILEKNGIEVPSNETILRFEKFCEHLIEVNSHTNLTAIRDLPDILAKHYVDSLLVSPYIPQNSTVLDIGCGAGFPSLPLAIFRQDLSVCAIDSTAKKIGFVAGTANILSLNNIKAYACRAEDAVTRKKLGEFDVVVSRAVSRMNILSELALPYVKIGGKLLALKAAKANEEADEAKSGILKLGGCTPELISYALNLFEGEPEPRCIISVTKTSVTPTIYPRSYALIVKKPL